MADDAAAGESSVVLKSSNAFLIRGTVELTNDGFIGEMILQQTYLDGSVTHWTGHFFADDAKSDGDQPARHGLLFGGKWDGDHARGNFAARQLFPRFDLLHSFADSIGTLATLKHNS